MLVSDHLVIVDLHQLECHVLPFGLDEFQFDLSVGLQHLVFSDHVGLVLDIHRISRNVVLDFIGL